MRARALAQQLSLNESAADWVATKAAFEALFGERHRAIEDANAAMANAPSPDVKLSVATALALAGKDAKPESLAREVAKSRPLDTWVQSVRVADIQAVIEMNRGQAAKAIDLLQAARPYDSADTETLFIPGEAYLKANRASDAEQEFQKVIELKNFSPDDPLIPLARLDLARADAIQGETAKARVQYRDFFALWQNADPDIPVLKQAKAEYARLR
jgi:eukaryotic-like serine/threonine-protein kinase